MDEHLRDQTIGGIIVAAIGATLAGLWAWLRGRRGDQTAEEKVEVERRSEDSEATWRSLQGWRSEAAAQSELAKRLAGELTARIDKLEATLSAQLAQYAAEREQLIKDNKREHDKFYTLIDVAAQERRDLLGMLGNRLSVLESQVSVLAQSLQAAGAATRRTGDGGAHEEPGT